MKRCFALLSALALTTALVFTACSGSGAGSGSASSTAGSLSAGDIETHTVNSVSFNMNFVPGGYTFTMTEIKYSTTQEVLLTKNFRMGETEVTQELWEAVTDTDAPRTDFGAGEKYPVYGVNWYEAVAFCNELTITEESSDANCVYYSDSECSTVYTFANAGNNDDVFIDLERPGYRLPTEAEWEYAARYIDGSSWNGGNHVSGDTSGQCTIGSESSTIFGQYAWYSGNADSTSHEVGKKRANELGLYDMGGNLFEWCYDIYESEYSGSTADAPDENPTGASSGSHRILRGGSWNNNCYYLQCAARYGHLHDPYSTGITFGFRLCKTEPEPAYRWQLNGTLEDSISDCDLIVEAGTETYDTNLKKEGSSSAAFYTSGGENLNLASQNEISFGDNTFSASLWLYVNSGGPIDDPEFLVWGDDRFYIKANDGNFYYGVYQSFLYNNEGMISDAFSPETWYHLVLTYDKPELCLYVNNRKYSITDSNTDISSISAPIHIGCDYMNGYIDDVIIFDRPLAEDDVNELYHSY